MSIVLDDTMRGVWFMTLPEDADWLLSVAETETHFEIVYRIRYHKDNKIFDSEDVKNWHKMSCLKEDTSLEETIRGVQKTFAAMKEMAEPDDAHELIRGAGTFDQFMEEFMKLPFVHSRVATAEEKAAYDMVDA